MTQTGAARELYDDQRGAVMITGLFMSCFLIGALWFIMGVGDAIIFRDRMQEAADSGVFTSAALHAKGMNFISACNLIMLVLIAVHMLLGIVHDVLLAVCIVSLGFGCGAWGTARRAYTAYERFFKPAVRVLHVLEVAAAYGYPYLGFVKGLQVGSNYGNDKKTGGVTVLAVSSSMVPGQIKIPGTGVQQKVTGTKKLGLPVEPEKFFKICQKIGNMVVDAGIRLAGRNPSSRGAFMRVFRRIVGNVAAVRYCNDLGSGATSAVTETFSEEFDRGNEAIGEANKDIDAENASRAENGDPLKDRIDAVSKQSVGGGLDPGFDRFWGEEGPLYVMRSAKNGNEWMQVWSINLSPKYAEQNERRVKIASRMGGGPDGEVSSFAYFAQAEFYFDCDKKWSDDGCNYDKNASYAIKWRARLRRAQAPAIGSFVGGWLFDALEGSQAYGNVKKWLQSNNPLFEKLQETIGGTVGKAVLGSAVEELISVLAGKGSGAAQNAGGALLNPEFSGIYH
jgi:hypothetical protein